MDCWDRPGQLTEPLVTSGKVVGGENGRWGRWVETVWAGGLVIKERRRWKGGGGMWVTSTQAEFTGGQSKMKTTVQVTAAGTRHATASKLGGGWQILAMDGALVIGGLIQLEQGQSRQTKHRRGAFLQHLPVNIQQWVQLWLNGLYLSLYFTDTAKHAHVMLQGLSFGEDFLPAFPVYWNLALSQYLIHSIRKKKKKLFLSIQYIRMHSFTPLFLKLEQGTTQQEKTGLWLVKKKWS